MRNVGYIADQYNHRIRKVTSVAAPQLGQITPFPAQTVDTASPAQAVTLRNEGGAAFGIQAITASGDFAVTHDCGTSLAAGVACTLQIVFTPADSGIRGGVLTIAGTSGDPLTSALGGKGVEPVFDISADLSLKLKAKKKAKIGKKLTYQFTLKNRISLPGSSGLILIALHASRNR